MLKSIGVNIPEDVWLTDLTATFKPSSPVNNSGDKGQNNGNIINNAVNGVMNATNGTNSSNESSENQMIIHGVAFSYYAVADWLEAIRQVKGLSDVRSQYAADENAQQPSQVRFEIRATIIPKTLPEPPKPKVVN
nr:PilN domain-containing protein [Heliobacterium chlorum]